jgi:hypothetical protein
VDPTPTLNVLQQVWDAKPSQAAFLYAVLQDRLEEAHLISRRLH